MQHKIVTPDVIQQQRGNKTVVLCQGCFDLVHVGHIKHFQAAKKFGDILVVAVTSDRFVNKGPGRPYFNQHLRMEQVASLEIVDYVVLSDCLTAEDAIMSVLPHVYVKGDEYKDTSKDITANIQKERDCIEAIGGRIEFTSEETFSSSELINKVFSPFTEDLQNFVRRASLHRDQIQHLFEKMKHLKVLVVGEIIYDQYRFVQPTGMPSKQSVVGSRLIKTETNLGGAYATARNVHQCCNSVSLCTLSSSIAWKPEVVDGEGIRILSEFIEPGYEIVKQRFIDESNRVLFRVDQGEDQLSHHTTERLRERLAQLLASNDYDLVIVNDFGHGMIDQGLASMLSAAPQYVAVNTQANGMNRGFNLITKYPRANYISLDLPEARLAMGDKFATADTLARDIGQKVPYEKLSITHGRNGTRVFSHDGTFAYVPVFSTDVIDTVGAGDAYFGITSMLAYLGADLNTIGFVGNAVGSLATRILGNSHPIDPILLRKYINTLLK